MTGQYLLSYSVQPTELNAAKSSEISQDYGIQSQRLTSAHAVENTKRYILTRINVQSALVDSDN